MNLRRVPVSGWEKCAYESVSFDTPGEARIATILDSSASVSWWLRNDPPILSIPTPAGGFEPDFIYAANRAGVNRLGLIEVKGALFWDGPGSSPRVKSAALCRWAAAIANSAADPKWEFAIVLDEDVVTMENLEEVFLSAQEMFRP